MWRTVKYDLSLSLKKGDRNENNTII